MNQNSLTLVRLDARTYEVELGEFHYRLQNVGEWDIEPNGDVTVVAGGKWNVDSYVPEWVGTDSFPTMQEALAFVLDDGRRAS